MSPEDGILLLIGELRVQLAAAHQRIEELQAQAVQAPEQSKEAAPDTPPYDDV